MAERQDGTPGQSEKSPQIAKLNGLITAFEVVDQGVIQDFYDGQITFSTPEDQRAAFWVFMDSVFTRTPRVRFVYRGEEEVLIASFRENNDHESPYLLYRFATDNDGKRTSHVQAVSCGWIHQDDLREPSALLGEEIEAGFAVEPAISIH